MQMLKEAGEVVGEFDDLSTAMEKKLGALVKAKVCVSVCVRVCLFVLLWSLSHEVHSLVRDRLLHPGQISACRAPLLHHALAHEPALQQLV